MQSTLLPFMLFAFVASITPGPTNILVLNNSARYGFKAALPIVFGACMGASGIVLLVASGVGQSLVRFPAVENAMHWVGSAWLSYLSWQIFNAAPQTMESHSPQKRLGLLGGAGLQLINPKTWMMAFAVVSTFAGDGADRHSHVVLLSLIFLLISLPCLGVWALLGAGYGRVQLSTRAMVYFNRCMGTLLLCSTWASAFS
ncbi:LysE family translocator [Pseudomonas sp.]|uniref:LysE family translocator n=1 Tax=Pseudomonas sp. TaxID=306 RepID=UPI0026068A25|nr:LysE family translocator [Pseudomonas sp.]